MTLEYLTTACRHGWCEKCDDEFPPWPDDVFVDPPGRDVVTVELPEVDAA